MQTIMLKKTLLAFKLSHVFIMVINVKMPQMPTVVGMIIVISVIGVAPITQLRTCVTQIVHNQGRSPYVVSNYLYHKVLLLKESIRSLWE